MFRGWGFLVTEMIGLIVLAALLGLAAGWLIWGRRDGDPSGAGRSSGAAPLDGAVTPETDAPQAADAEERDDVAGRPISS